MVKRQTAGTTIVECRRGKAAFNKALGMNHVRWTPAEELSTMQARSLVTTSERFRHLFPAQTLVHDNFVPPDTSFLSFSFTTAGLSSCCPLTLLRTFISIHQESTKDHSIRVPTFMVAYQKSSSLKFAPHWTVVSLHQGRCLEVLMKFESATVHFCLILLSSLDHLSLQPSF